MTNEQQEQERLNLERLMVLSGVTDADPLWKAVLSYADEHVRNCMDVALKSGLSDGERQFEAGRASSAADFAEILRTLWRKSKTLSRS